MIKVNGVVHQEIIAADEVDAAQFALSHQRMVSNPQSAYRFGEKLPRFVEIGQIGVCGLWIHQDIHDVQIMAQGVGIRVPGR